MTQFDLYKNSDSETAESYPFLLNIQNDLLDDLNTRVVIPLAPVRYALSQYPDILCPSFTIDNRDYVLLTHQLASVKLSFLGKPYSSLHTQRDEIIAALDLLITGI